MKYRARHAAGQRKHDRIRKIIRAALLVLFLVVLAVPVFEARNPVIETVALTSEDLPADVGQLKIIYLSDIHQGFFYSMGRVEDLVARVNAMNPDLILLGGDYATSSDSAIEFFRQAPSFHARYAVFGVLGDADRSLPESNLELLRQTMRAAGVTPLVNEAASLRIGSGTVWIAGLDDPSAGRPDLDAVTQKLRRGDYAILLCHSPAIIPSALSAAGADGLRGWFDLGLFGHTHGGQLPIVGRRLLHLENIPGRYMRGWLEENRTALLISSGIGTSAVPMRLFCRPQIHLITVRAGR